jgi:hypothetical protein
MKLDSEDQRRNEVDKYIRTCVQGGRGYIPDAFFIGVNRVPFSRHFLFA